MGIGNRSTRRDRSRSGTPTTESLLTIVRGAQDTRGHAEEFVERYDWLHSWCLRLTGHDREQAKDLLHDAFVHFTVSRPDLSTIDNLEAFFYTLLRNLYLSQMRRFSMRQGREVHVTDLDSLEMVLRRSDARGQAAAQDDLIRVCEYALQWKETNKAGSALILRFFQGYYPSEVMRVLKGNRMLVDRLLRIGRIEARSHLERAAETQAVRMEIRGFSLGAPCPGSTDDFLQALRNTILQPANGHCMP